MSANVHTAKREKSRTEALEQFAWPIFRPPTAQTITHLNEWPRQQLYALVAEHPPNATTGLQI